MMKHTAASGVLVACVALAPGFVATGSAAPIVQHDMLPATSGIVQVHGGGHGHGHGGGGHGHGGGHHGGGGHGHGGGHHGGGGHHYDGHYGYYGYYDYGPSYYYGGDTYGECRSLRRRAVRTGSRYWWRRYRDCVDGY